MPQQSEGSNLNCSTWNCTSRFSVLSKADVDNKFIPFAGHFQKSTISLESPHKYNTLSSLVNWALGPLRIPSFPLVPFQMVHCVPEAGDPT